MHEICFIDDSIPANKVPTINETERLNGANIRMLLEDGVDWDEVAVKELASRLAADPGNWSISAFTNPAFYLKAIEEGTYRPEIIIYDWEYPAVEADSATSLIEILNSTYAVVYIYSSGDHEAQIDQAVAETQLSEFYGKRLFILKKDDVNSVQTLLEQSTEFYSNNFSYKFGKILRNKSIIALDKVLVQFGSHDLDQSLPLILSQQGTEETDVKAVIAEKIKHYLMEDGAFISEVKKGTGFDDEAANELITSIVSNIVEKINTHDIDLSGMPDNIVINEENSDAAIAMWSLRLYYSPSDSIVRRGDVVVDGQNRFYIIITPDCDLVQFWKKNFGYINLIPLYDFQVDADPIKSKIGLVNTAAKVKSICEQIRIGSSLVNPDFAGMPESIFICPLIKIGAQYHDFIGFPKEIVSSYVKPKELVGKEEEHVRRFHRLDYENFVGFQRIATISEPFLTSLVQYCINKISGYGAPDYPQNLRPVLSNKIKCSIVPEDHDDA